MSDSRTAVVILNWNGREFLERFLPSVARYSQDFSEIVVVDNASTDESVLFVRNHYPDVRIIQNPENGGFAKGYNEGLKQIEADYYVLLNSDVEVTEGWLSPLVKMMDSDPKIGACQPKVLSWHERDKFEYAGAAGGFIDAYGYPFCRGRIFDITEIDAGQYDEPCEIFWATGACMMVRADLYHCVDGLDDDFFAHMEEIDLCWRMKNSGYRLMACPESVVYHVGGGTLSKSSPRKTYLNFRNNLFLLVKNLPVGRLLWVLFVRSFLDCLALLMFLLKGGWGDAGAVLKAQLHFILGFGHCWRKRTAQVSSRLEGMYGGSIIWAHHVQKADEVGKLKQDKWVKS